MRYPIRVSTSHPDLVLPPGEAELAAMRQDAAAAEDDRSLLHLRELELATESLPPLIDGVRRTRLLAVDPLATTWEGWRTEDGQRVIMRCLRSRWRNDPVIRRRFEEGAARAARLTGAELRPAGDWPHLRADAPGSSIIDRLPVEDPPEPRTLARLLGTGLAELARLHDAGLRHGGPFGALLLDGVEGPRLLWLDTFQRNRSIAAELSALGATVAALDPDGIDPIGALALAWATDPPPSAQVGLDMLRKTMASQLLAARHRLVIAGRMIGRRGRATRLAQATRALGRALPPPPMRACLHARPDGVLVLASSDGLQLHGGTSAAPQTQRLPRVWTPDDGVAAQAARVLLRAWATRADGDEDRRAQVQQALGATDADTERLVRWLRATTGLRRARLLLEHQARF